MIISRYLHGRIKAQYLAIGTRGKGCFLYSIMHIKSQLYTNIKSTLLQICYRSLHNSVTEVKVAGCVAQLNRASDYGSEGFRFES